MGRKTWESSPKNRPFPGRLNLVLSHSYNPTDEVHSIQEPVFKRSIEDALDYLGCQKVCQVYRVYVIGGTDTWAAALASPAVRNIVTTRIFGDFHCDQFFPLRLDDAPISKNVGWVRGSHEKLINLTGVPVPLGEITNVRGTRYEFELWEKHTEQQEEETA